MVVGQNGGNCETFTNNGIGCCNSVVCRGAKMRNSHRDQRGGYNLAVAQKSGKCETFIKNGMGVVIPWCAEERNVKQSQESVWGLQLGCGPKEGNV